MRSRAQSPLTDDRHTLRQCVRAILVEQLGGGVPVAVHEEDGVQMCICRDERGYVWTVGTRSMPLVNGAAACVSDAIEAVADAVVVFALKPLPPSVA